MCSVLSLTSRWTVTFGWSYSYFLFVSSPCLSSSLTVCNSSALFDPGCWLLLASSMTSSSFSSMAVLILLGIRLATGNADHKRGLFPVKCFVRWHFYSPMISVVHCPLSGYGHVVQHHQRTSSQVVDVVQHVRSRLNFLYNILPATDILYNTTNGRAHNKSTTCCTTKSPPTDKNLLHPNILICRDVGLWHCDVANLLYNWSWKMYGEIALEAPEKGAKY